MKVVKVETLKTLKPSDRKMKNLKKIAENISEKSGLPKEMPLEKDIFIFSENYKFETIKDQINNTIQNIKG